MCWGQVLILEYFCADRFSLFFFKQISKSDEYPSPDSSLNDVLPEWNFENQFWTRSSTMLSVGSLGSSFNFQLFQPSCQAFGDNSKGTYYNWYHRHLHVP